jgi:hypothetical protein
LEGQSPARPATRPGLIGDANLRPSVERARLPGRRPRSIERRAPEGAEVVPKALLSRSAAAAPLFGKRCLPGPSGGCWNANRVSFVTPRADEMLAKNGHCGNLEIAHGVKKRLMNRRFLHIRPTGFPPFGPHALDWNQEFNAEVAELRQRTPREKKFFSAHSIFTPRPLR